MIQVSSFSRPVLKPPVLSPVCQSLPSVQQSEHQLRNSIPKPLSHRNTWAASLALRAARAAFLWSIISLAWESSMGNFIYPFRFLLFLNPSMTWVKSNIPGASRPAASQVFQQPNSTWWEKNSFIQYIAMHCRGLTVMFDSSAWNWSKIQPHFRILRKSLHFGLFQLIHLIL